MYVSRRVKPGSYAIFSPHTGVIPCRRFVKIRNPKLSQDIEENGEKYSKYLC